MATPPEGNWYHVYTSLGEDARKEYKKLILAFERTVREDVDNETVTGLRDCMNDVSSSIKMIFFQSTFTNIHETAKFLTENL